MTTKQEIEGMLPKEKIHKVITATNEQTCEKDGSIKGDYYWTQEEINRYNSALSDSATKLSEREASVEDIKNALLDSGMNRSTRTDKDIVLALQSKFIILKKGEK